MAECGDGKTQTFHIRMGNERPSQFSVGKNSGRKSGRPRLPATSPYFNRGKSDMISYEDLLVAQYLDELKKQNFDQSKEKNISHSSPYMQRNRQKRRPMSACVSLRPQSGKPKIDAKFIADANLWDPATPRDIRHTRPASAPVKRPRPLSGVSHRSRPPSGRKSIFKNMPHMVKAHAYVNGSRDKFVYLAAPDLKIFLEFATVKLDLPFAARRVFLENGEEVYHEKDIPHDGEVYISMGEKYKDPYQATKRSMIARNLSKWTLTGIVLPDKGRKKGVRTKLSKRMKALCLSSTVRILVFRNGDCKEPVEVVTELDNIDDFFLACTAKLGLGVAAKVAYDVEGNRISDLSDASELLDEDDEGSRLKNPIRGPLWVSTGALPLLDGMGGYLKRKLNALKDHLKTVKQFKQDVDGALENDEKSTNPEVAKMKIEDLYEMSAEVDEDIAQYEDRINLVKKQLITIRNRLKEEPSLRGTKSSLYKIHGINLKVYENGKYDGEFSHFFNLTEASKGLSDPPKAKEHFLAKLLEELSNSKLAAGAKRNLSVQAKKLFDQYGNEIKDVTKLENDQPVWLSFGEPFIEPFTYCLQVFLDRAVKLTGPDGEDKYVRENIGPNQEEMTKYSNKWEATIGFPALFEMDETHKLEYDEAKTEYLLENSEINGRNHFMLLKDENDFALYPEVAFSEKANLRKQVWVISKAGQIHCKAFPQLCLAVSDTSVEANLFNRDVKVSGLVVTMQKKMVGNPSQIWSFSETDAVISCDAHPNLLLTYLGNKSGDEEGYHNNAPVGCKIGERVSLIVTEALQRKDASFQRFALKQEKFENLGQWKFTQASNQEWNRQAYSWPVKKDGSLNEEFDWPMEAYLLPHAPPLHKTGSKMSISGMLPVRLKVLKNGDRSIDDAISVVGPNLTTMLQGNAKKEQASKNKKNRNKNYGQETVEDDVDFDLHCMDKTLTELEVLMFLDHCTSLLNLPFAARRVFDANGTEIFTLQSLERDQLVYVSTGEAWSNPKLSKIEQKRRFLLSQLSSDVAKIQHYCSLRNPENYVLELEGPWAVGCGLVVNTQWTMEDEGRGDRRLNSKLEDRSSSRLTDRTNLMERSMDEEEKEDEESHELTAHEKSHLRSEERANTLKWPWERLVNVNESMDNEDPEANKYSDRDLYEKFKPPVVKTQSQDTLQRFVFEDGFIALQANKAFVLTSGEAEGHTADVMLTKRKPDDIFQRWFITETGEIKSRANQNLVLTVSLPNTALDEPSPFSFDRSPVTLQRRRTNQFGKAHQRWRYDAETGLIHAFSADLPDKEITAANRADVCTFSIAEKVDIDQPGYIVEIPNSNSPGCTNYKVCISCARAMRGRYKVQKLPHAVNFHCAMGEAKRLKIKQVGSFKVLNNKVDLSTFEADITLSYWQETLDNLREQTNVQTIAKEINAARTVRTVKVMAYKNGEGRLRKGEIICGSSIEGILMQCTHRLEMNNAARRMYLEDGEIVLDVDDLVRHAVDNCKNEMIDMVLLEKAEKEGNNVKTEEENEEEDEASQLEQLQQVANEEINKQMKMSFEILEGKELNNAGRGGEEGEEEEESEQQEEDSQQKDLDNEEARKIQREREALLHNIRLPGLDVILRAPIEVWVSSSKAFVSPEVVESKEENRRKKRQFRSQVCLALDIDKHVLRQLKGRRFDKMEPGEYKSTLSSKRPVVIEKNWQELTVEEQDKHNSVHKLQTHLGEIRENQAERRVEFSGATLERLYQQPNMKRVLVYPNGETSERAVNVWGETLAQILESCTDKLGLWRQARILYTPIGKKIETFADIQRDQLLCASTGKPFLQPAFQRVNIEVKANWGRARKMHGKRATDVIVDVEKNPQVDVDPFGPPQLALPVENTNNS